MKISVMSIAFRELYRKGEMDVSDFVRICAQLAVDGVEITRSDEQGVEQRTEQALKETGLAVSSYNLSAAILSADQARQTEAWEAFRDGLDRAKRLRAGSVMVFPGPLQYTDPDRERKSWIAACKVCAAYAEAKDLLVTMENIGSQQGIPIRGKVAHMREIVEGVGSPFFRLAFDTGNFLMAEEDPGAALQELAPFVAHIHLKDVVIRRVGREGRYTETAVGAGVVDFQPIFEELRARDYAAFVSLECAGGGGRAPKEHMVEISVRNTRKMLDRWT